jgi:hypothetical protein
MDERALTLPPDVLYGLLRLQQGTGGAPRTFYVSTSGSDSNSGRDPATPWQTVTKVNGASLLPGDVVLFKGGDTFSGTTLNPTVSGVNGQPIVYGSYGYGRATISTSALDGVILGNISWITIRDLIIVGGATAMGAKGGINAFSSVAPAAAGNIVLDSLDISQFMNGIEIGGSLATTGYSNVTINNCDLHGNRDNGLLTYSNAAWVAGSPAYSNSNVTVTNCRAYSNLGNAANTTSQSGNGLILASVNGGTISNCTTYSNGANNAFTGGGPVGCWTYQSNNVTIKNCLSYSNRSNTTADGDGFDIDINSTNCVIEYCLAYDNNGAGILVWNGTTADHHNNTVRYNILWGNGRSTSAAGFYGEITTGGTISNLAVYNNTVYAKPNATPVDVSAAEITSGTYSGVTFRNNVFYTASATNAVVRNAAASATSAVLMQGNAYYGPTVNAVKWGATTYTSLATWRAAVAGQEQIAASNVGVLGTDPVLSSPSTAPTVTDASTMTTYTGLQLLSTSPVLQAGLDLNALFAVNPGTVDFYGAAPTVPVSIGADEQDIGANYVTLAGATAYTSANATTVTTPSFTPADSTLLVVYCSMGNGLGGASSLGQVSDSVNGTTGWVRLAGDASATGGVAEIWARDIGTGAAMTVTYDPGGAGASGLDIIAEWYSNARPVASQPGATATNGGTTAYTTTVTTTVSGSIVAGALGRATDAQTVTANGMTTKLGQVNGTSGDTAALFRSTSLTGITGTLVLGFTNPAAGANRMALAEILPASTGSTATADAALAVTATLSATATATHIVDGALSVTAAVSAAATASHPVDGALAATATLTAAATRTALVDGALAATATLTAAATRTAVVDGALPATATLSAAASATYVLTAALAVTATTSATLVGTRPADAALSATATLTAAATRTAVVDGALPVTATMTATIARTQFPTAALAVTATLTASAAAVINGALPVAATLTAAAVRTALVDASLPVTATLTAGMSATYRVDGSLAVSVTLSASGFRLQLAGGALAVLAAFLADAAAQGSVTFRPFTGTTGRPGSGTTLRPGTGTTARPGSGVTNRPYTGATTRP